MKRVELLTGSDLMKRRKALGLTQKEFALKATVSPRTITNFEAYDLVSGSTRRLCEQVIKRAEEALKPNSTAEDFPWLRLSTPRWDPETCGPASLLRPEFEIVPFHGKQRKRDLESLIKWCRDASPFSARLYTAEGGAGKTRLGRELCHWARRNGWIAGFAESDEFPGSRALESTMAAAKAPILVVVDYAGESDKLQILERVLKAPRACDTIQLRVLMLDRDSQWLSRLEPLLGTDDRLAAGGVTRQPWKLKLEPAAPDAEERRATYRAAALAFADRLKEKPASAPGDLADSEVYQNLLMTHARALVPPKKKTAPSQDILVFNA